MRELAVCRGIEPDKFTNLVLARKMRIAPYSAQDTAVTLAANCCIEFIDEKDKEAID